jgi:EAL domain-containing protein (putative c-di-GMP-specific phosphodiesterase class I)
MEVQIVCDEAISRELSQIAAGENVDRLFLLYQPIFDLKTNQIYGFEALARLSSDDPVLVPPLKFIPIAERTKLIVPVGEIILRKALYFLQKVEEEGYDTINMSINISAIQLLREGFIETLVDVIREYKIAPERICLEFTESIFFSDFENINSVLSEVKRYGIKVALDDFGTGYSSFAREQELNIDCLKIDKSFIDKLMEVEAAESITGDIISMAHKIGHYVVAEGVEHEKQLQYLKDHDCDKVQGYLIGKPLSEDDTLELLKKNKNTI